MSEKSITPRTEKAFLDPQRQGGRFTSNINQHAISISLYEESKKLEIELSIANDRLINSTAQVRELRHKLAACFQLRSKVEKLMSQTNIDINSAKVWVEALNQVLNLMDEIELKL